jgi:hypothetical protein
MKMVLPSIDHTQFLFQERASAGVSAIKLNPELIYTDFETGKA